MTNENGLSLQRALRASQASRTAFVGAGGKTTAVFQLARELNPPVLVTASTHLGQWQLGWADRHIRVLSPADVELEDVQGNGVTVLTGPIEKDERASGLDAASLEAVYQLAERLACAVLVEADGSRQRPLKAPAAHEPAVPGWVRDVVVVAGMAGIGQPLSADAVHRPERFAELSGLEMGEMIDEAALARVLTHAQGGLKEIPNGARRTALLNQVVGEGRLHAANQIARNILGEYDTVIVANLLPQASSGETRTSLALHTGVLGVYEPVVGILLAGGESRRLGQPKALLEWHGKALIRYAAEAALSAGLRQVVVVLGAVREPIRKALEGLPVTFVENDDWAEGQSTSVKAGLRFARRQNLRQEPGAAVFLLVDQPFVNAGLLRALVKRHCETLAPVIVPRVNGQRANPVLFDRETFEAFEGLKGDVGGRAIIRTLEPEWIDLQDERLLTDVDTPEDLERLRGMEAE